MEASTIVAATGAAVWLSYVASALALGAINLLRAKSEERSASAKLLNARAKVALAEAGLLEDVI